MGVLLKNDLHEKGLQKEKDDSSRVSRKRKMPVVPRINREVIGCQPRINGSLVVRSIYIWFRLFSLSKKTFETIIFNI